MKKNKFGAALVLVVAGSLASHAFALADAKTEKEIAKAQEQFAKGKTDALLQQLEKRFGQLTPELVARV